MMKPKTRPSVIFPRTVFGPRCTCFRIPTLSTDLLQRVCIPKQTCCGSERTPTLASIKEMDSWVFKVRPMSEFFDNCFLYDKYRPKPLLGLNCKDSIYHIFGTKNMLVTCSPSDNIHMKHVVKSSLCSDIIL